MGNLDPGWEWTGETRSRGLLDCLGSKSAPGCCCPAPLGAWPLGVEGALLQPEGGPDPVEGALLPWLEGGPPLQSLLLSPFLHWGFLESGGGLQ